MYAHIINDVYVAYRALYITYSLAPLCLLQSFSMPTHPSSSASSTFKGRKGQSKKRFSNFYSLKLLWDDINNIRRIWLNCSKGWFLKVKIVHFQHVMATGPVSIQNKCSVNFINRNVHKIGVTFHD